ncbi:hypothetical protein B0G69_7730 [Paraburkholderia sp. RAU2J]|nr:hypothetical protein B0G69_7730 [Paraburkholderia sp. RAU2J]
MRQSAANARLIRIVQSVWQPLAPPFAATRRWDPLPGTEAFNETGEGVVTLQKPCL